MLTRVTGRGDCLGGWGGGGGWPSRLKDNELCVLQCIIICVLVFMYYNVCYFTSIFYAVVRLISMLSIDSKDSVF